MFYFSEDLGRCSSIPNEMPYGLVVETNDQGPEYEYPVGGMVGLLIVQYLKSKSPQMNIVCDSPTEKLTEQIWDLEPWDGKMSVLCGLGNALPGEGRGKWNISTISAQATTSCFFQPSSIPLFLFFISFQCRTYCPSPEILWNQTTMASTTLPLEVDSLYFL